MSPLVIFPLITLSIGALLWALLPYLTGEAKAEARLSELSKPNAKKAFGIDRNKDSETRRKQVTDTLKEMEGKRKNKISLETRMLQAGVSWTRQKFFVICGLFSFTIAILTLLISQNLILTILSGLAAGAGVPFWILSFLKKRRIKRFTEQFPNAIDIIVRGVKSGLPLGDCIRNIASDSPEPLRSEFRLIVESLSIGLVLPDAITRIAERVPTPETNFFAIVIAIQQRAGGNLAEALGNLSRILRDRKRMREKVKAVSSEANASAAIIGSLPILVGLAVFVLNPSYINVMTSDPTGQFVLFCGGLWMTAGIIVMRKMINFDI